MIDLHWVDVYKRQVQGEFGAASIIMRPAVEGTGVIAGGAVRPLFELAGIKTVSFDRGGRVYHGRVKALADGARAAGLEF